MSTITKAAIITQTSTCFVPLADAAHHVTRSPGSYVYRVWEVNPDTREYVFDTGISSPQRPFDAAQNFDPVCIFPQPLPQAATA